jgi:AraC-like DNA-binding protein
VSSQLERIADWALLAKKARYQPKELAKLIKVSLRQLERYFLDRFARPPQDWLDELRLIHAAHLLAKGFRIKEAAEKLGFQNVSHFSKKFNRFYGCRPSAFVQIHDRRLTVGPNTPATETVELNQKDGPFWTNMSLGDHKCRPGTTE